MVRDEQALQIEEHQEVDPQSFFGMPVKKRNDDD
jgi:hypothetical protein